MSKKFLFTTFIILSFILLLVAATITFRSTRDEINNKLILAYAAQQQTLANQLAKSIETEIQNIEEKLLAISEIEDVRAGVQSTCTATLEEVSNSFIVKPNNIGRVDKNGLFVCSINKALIGTKAANLGSYVTDIFSDPEHKPVASRIISIPNIGYAIAIHIPIFDKNGNFDGTIGAAIYLKDIESKFLTNFKIGTTGFASLLDDNGDILYHPREDFQAKNINSDEIQNAINHDPQVNDYFVKSISGFVGYSRYVFTGQERVAAYAPVRINQNRIWSVNVILPIEEAYSSINNAEVSNQIRRLFIINFGLTFVIFTTLLFILIKSLLSPLGKISQAAIKIGNGDLDTKIDIKSNDEIGKLAGTLNQMTGKLKNYYKDLQSEVRQKTEALEKANLQLKSKFIDEKKHAQKVESESKETEEVNKIMIDREIKMTALKTEIEDLKRQLGQEVPPS
jgi:nitrogen fixation/metabolism regulation signal transduction histidine kinase